MVNLGEKVEDTITGFKGIAVGKVEYLYGCWQIQIEGVDQDKQPKTWWFDEQRVVKVKSTEEDVKPIVPIVDLRRSGGPQNKPTGRQHPSSTTCNSE